MALYFADGFEHYGTTANVRGVYLGNKAVLSTDGTARTGDACIYTAGDSGLIQFPLTAFTGQYLIMSLAYMRTAMPIKQDTQYLVKVEDKNLTTSLSIAVQPDGSISVHNPFGEIFNSGANSFSANAWNSIQFFLFCDPNNGSFEMRLNGSNNSVCNLDGISTSIQAGPDNIGQIEFGTNSWGIGNFYFDDLYIANNDGAFDNNFVGDIRCRLVLANANGPDQDWTATGQANAFDAISQIPPDPANDYISADAVDQVSDFAIQPVPGNTSFSAGFFAHVQAYKSDSGAASAELSIISGASETVPVELNPGTTAGYTYVSFETDPATGGYWTKEALQAAMPKFKRTL